MIVGFKILNLMGYVQEAIDYISSVIYVPNAVEVATNIVNTYETTNIFSTKVTQEALDTLPFTTQAIEHVSGVFCWSIVDFPVEMPYRDENGILQKIIFKPTDYMDGMPYSIAQQLLWYKENNYINFMEEVYAVADWSGEDFSEEDWLTP